MNVLLIVGEKSAENYASLLIDRLREIKPRWRFFSVCSTLLKTKTVKILDYTSISVIGIREALSVARKAYEFLQRIKQEIIKNHIEMVILLDFPEFNLKIARFAHSRGIKVVYYIIPQVWAWREYRVKQLKEWCDLIIPILPFERLFLTTREIEKTKISYSGHPIVDVLYAHINKQEERNNTVLIMPGSRESEIRHNAPVMLKAADTMHSQDSSLKIVWAMPEHLKHSEAVRGMLKQYPFVATSTEPHSLMKRAKFGILKSGTTTLEAALLGLPMVVSYRVAHSSYLLGRLLIRNIKHVSLPNLIAGRGIVRELIQTEAKPENIIHEFEAFKRRDGIYRDMEKNFKAITLILGEYPVSMRIAQSIASLS